MAQPKFRMRKSVIYGYFPPGVKWLLIANTAIKQIDGYTPQQRFFLSYGQIWCQNVTDQEARKRALTDPHSPGRWRVNGAVQNSAAFQEAFGCHAGQPMVAENACRVW